VAMPVLSSYPLQGIRIVATLSSGTLHLRPFCECSIAKQPVVRDTYQMTAKSKRFCRKQVEAQILLVWVSPPMNAHFIKVVLYSAYR